jgi:hypothetical protein
VCDKLVSQLCPGNLFQFAVYTVLSFFECVLTDETGTKNAGDVKDEERLEILIGYFLAIMQLQSTLAWTVAPICSGYCLDGRGTYLP